VGTARKFDYHGCEPEILTDIDPLTFGERKMRCFRRWGFAVLALVLAAGWSYREVAFATGAGGQLGSGTFNLDGVEMAAFADKGDPVGKIGVYLSGDTPASEKFVTGRFVLAPGKSPHAPHTHPEEEVMIVESGHGEIFCDGKTTKVGSGSVMYTTPNAAHGITNTGSEPIVFYFVKWASKK
jgi:mannose-6-phosphate isomerase-like protein (cupin superfamily)